MTKLNELTITEAAAKLRAKECTVEELWDACVTAAEDKNKELNAYLEIFEKDKEAIAAAQARIDGGDAPMLCGIPLAIKDNILIEGKIASAASKILENHRAAYDATIIKKLKDAGALFVGRTNMDEFAMGSSTENSAYGPSRNPHDPSRVPGGSSGGSAAAVAGHMALGALGTDTGGSIRQPAAYCGLVGLKPTYGSVSRNGLIALGSSLDQAGPLTKSVEDAKLMYEAIKGKDPLDSTSLDTKETYGDVEIPNTFRIGVPEHLLSEGVDERVKTLFEAQLETLKKEGHTIVPVSLPTSVKALAAYYIIQPAEASANLARYDGMRYGKREEGDTLLDDFLNSRSEGIGREPTRRILLGTFVLSSGYIDAYYKKAQAARELMREEYNTAFKECDVIAFPSTLSVAFTFGERSNPVAMYLEDMFTVTANLTGMPAISVPMGTIEEGGVALPSGIHFTAPLGGDARLFTIGAQVAGKKV